MFKLFAIITKILLFSLLVYFTCQVWILLFKFGVKTNPSPIKHKQEILNLESHILELEEDNQNAISLIMSLENEIQILSSCCALSEGNKN